MTTADEVEKSLYLAKVQSQELRELANVFLADRTIGRAFGTKCRLSSVCRRRLSSVTFCIVAKRYVLAKNCLKE